MVWNGIDFEKTTCDNFTVVETNTTSWTNGNWYVVYYDVTIDSRINVSGTVNLILVDGATLTASKGIGGAGTLNIYGQKNASSSIVIDNVDDGVAAISNLTIVGMLDVFAGNDEASAEYVTDYARAYSYMTIKAHKHVCGNDINDVSYYTCRGCDGIDPDRKAVYDAVQEVKALIAAIGSVRYTPESAENIEAARVAFDNLPAEVQALVDTLDTLTVAESTYATLKNVEDLIDAIGEVEYTAVSKEKIEAARTAFDALPEDVQARVSSAGALTEAESTYEVKEVVAFIEGIGDVEYTEEVKAKIDAAKEKYEALSKEQQAQVTNTATLDTAEDTYEVKEVEAIIENIGEVEYTDEVKAKIDAAKEKLGALTDEQKAQIANAETLANAESTYEVIETIAFINEIGVVAYDDDTRELIAKAREAYNNLSDEQKAQVGVVETLTQAEEAYTELAVEAISDLIDVDEVSFDDKDDVLAAKEAFEALTPEEQALVDPETVAKLNAAFKVINDIVTSTETTEAIVDLPEIGELSLDDKDAVEAAREALEALSPEALAKVSFETIAILEAAEKEIADIEESNEATEAIVELPEVGELTLDDKEDVIAAREAYEALSPEAKAKVSQETLEVLAAAEKEIVDIEESNEATETIVELPVVGELSLENKAAIEAAREAYNDLSAEGKAKVSQEIVAKLNAAVKEIVDIETSNEATETITALPTESNVEIEDEAAIEAARAAFEALSDEGKAKVSAETKAKLEAAEEVITDIKSIVVTKEEGTTTYAKEISEEAAETGVSVKQLFKKAASDEDATKEAVIKSGDTTVAFDAAAVNAIGDKDTSFSVKVSDQAPEGAEMQIDLELNGATFAEGAAKVSTKFEKEVPKGKKLVVYHLANGIKTAVQSWLNNGKLTFATNHFSTYIVVFEDAEAAEIKDAGLSGGAIAGIVIGCFFGLLIIACAVLFLLHKKGIVKLAFIDVVIEKVTSLFKKK